MSNKKWYSVKTFAAASDNSLGTALNEAERDLLVWLEQDQAIELISVATQYYVDEKVRDKYMFMITVAYARSTQGDA